MTHKALFYNYASTIRRLSFILGILSLFLIINPLNEGNAEGLTEHIHSDTDIKTFIEIQNRLNAIFSRRLNNIFSPESGEVSEELEDIIEEIAEEVAITIAPIGRIWARDVRTEQQHNLIGGNVQYQLWENAVEKLSRVNHAVLYRTMLGDLILGGDQTTDDVYLSIGSSTTPAYPLTIVTDEDKKIRLIDKDSDGDYSMEVISGSNFRLIDEKTGKRVLRIQDNVFLVNSDSTGENLLRVGNYEHSSYLSVIPKTASGNPVIDFGIYKNSGSNQELFMRVYRGSVWTDGQQWGYDPYIEVQNKIVIDTEYYSGVAQLNFDSSINTMGGRGINYIDYIKFGSGHWIRGGRSDIDPNYLHILPAGGGSVAIMPRIDTNKPVLKITDYEGMNAPGSGSSEYLINEDAGWFGIRVDSTLDKAYLSYNIGPNETNPVTIDVDGNMVVFVSTANYALTASTAAYADDSNLLDGLDSTAFAQLSATQTFTGSNTFTNEVTISSHTSISGNLTVDKKLIFGDVPVQNLETGSTILSGDSYYVISSTSDIVMTATPTIVDGTDGDFLILRNTGTYYIDIQDDAVLAGSKMFYGGSNAVIAPKDVISFLFDALIDGWVIQSHPNLQVAGANADIILVRNTSGSTIPAIKAVYASGYNVGLHRILIGLADADDSGKMPSIGITPDSIADGANGVVVISGIIEANLSAYSLYDILYASTTAGGLTNARPTVDEIQALAIVTRAHTKGSMIVMGAGRTNDVPVNFTANIITVSSLTITGANVVLTATSTYSLNSDLLDGLDSTAFLGTTAVDAEFDTVLISDNGEVLVSDNGYIMRN